MSKARKALVAAVTPVLIILLSWGATGQLDTQELAVALSGALVALLVYLVPNQPESHDPHADNPHIDR